jgi:hypothetical protein
VQAHADVWEKVIRKLRAGMMPPAGVPRPDDTSRRSLVSSLETTLDAAARSHPNPGRPLAHRLNRAEYANAVRDLLSLDVDVTAMLPPDDSSGGFDNNADVLGVSPCARKLSHGGRADQRARDWRSEDPANRRTFRIRQDASQDRLIDGLPLGTIGGLRLHTTLRSTAVPSFR